MYESIKCETDNLIFILTITLTLTITDPVTPLEYRTFGISHLRNIEQLPSKSANSNRLTV